MKSEEIKAKLKILASTAFEVPNIIAEAEKLIGGLLAQTESVQNNLIAAREEYNKVLKDTQDYKKEFMEKIKVERDALEMEKRESKSLMLLAQSKATDADKFLSEAHAKARSYTDKLAEVESLKAQAEERLNRIKSFVQTQNI